ncbi:MAG TPA: site-2 protease family protein [Anaeromyxobacter sp.]|nr:site-2 protease family protein [Anaeromyxobacter sp.]
MTGFLFNAGAIVLLLGGLIFVHELGHFLVAKAMRVKVLRFSLGFGPRLLGFRRGETEYRISALPLGGYVKMAGDDPTEAPAPEDRGRGFLEQAPWKRLAIAVAGPGMNLVFPGAIFVALALALNGNPTEGPVIGTVAPGAPAAAAGLRPGDRILSVAAPGAPARPIRYFSDLRKVVSPHPGEPLVFRVERDGREIEPLTIVPKETEDRNPVETTRRGVIGVAPTYATATVAPVAPGAAGPLEPFDLVVAAGGKPIRHAGDLTAVLEAARCAPLDLEVVRERPLQLPGATLGTFAAATLRGVPTCAGGEPTFRLADPEVSTFVAAVAPGSPAAKAGLVRGDAIASLDGKPVQTFLDVQALARDLEAGVAVSVGLASGRTVQLVPENETFVDELSKEKIERLSLGFSTGRRAAVDPAALATGKVPFVRGPIEILEAAWDELVFMVRLNVLGVARILTGKIPSSTIGGPLMIMSMATEAAAEGWGPFLRLMALISVNLALMNLLPIPVLDGGHITQALLESVTRRPLSVRAREIANVVGLILLFGLMLFAFKNDIMRMVS